MSWRRATPSLSIFLAVVVVIAGAHVIDLLRFRGAIPRGVWAGPVELSGMDREGALRALSEHERALAQPVELRLGRREAQLDPHDVALYIDREAIVERAMHARPREGPLARFRGWIDSFVSPVHLDVEAHFDRGALARFVDHTERDVLSDPPRAGGVELREGIAHPIYPKPGTGIVRAEAMDRLEDALQKADRQPVYLALRELPAPATAAEVDDAVRRANRLVGAAIDAVAEAIAFELRVEPEVLARWLRVEFAADRAPKFSVGLDAAAVEAWLTPYRALLDGEARDAVYVVDEEDRVTLSPSRPGTHLSTERAVRALQDAAERASRVADLQLAEVSTPRFSTARALALPIAKVAEFTTEHPPNQPRVTNIQRMAAELDGRTIMPGAVFSLNKAVGPRTEEGGYVAAPMIFGGEIVDSVGGGVSQLATTLYNAVFYGCYQDISHKPHSYYYSRYPELTEATVSWPQPDLVFRNDTTRPLVIKTAISPTSITVKLFGYREGRTCERRLGKRKDVREPAIEYQADPTLRVGQSFVDSPGQRGFSNEVFRLMEMPDGRVLEQRHRWTYLPKPRVVRVHPCKMPGARVACP